MAQTGAHVQSCKRLSASSFPGVLYQNGHPFHLQVRLRLGKLPSDLLTALVRVLPLEVLELKVDASVFPPVFPSEDAALHCHHKHYLYNTGETSIMKFHIGY